MSKLKKFFIVFLSLFPFTAGAVAPLLIGLGIGAASIAGFSIYRSFEPVNMSDSLQFFSSCWTCQVFSSIMAYMSTILPKIYSGIGKVIIPIAAMLTIVYFIWNIASEFINSKIIKAGQTAYDYSKHLLKLALVCGLLLIPLPRLISDIAIDPIFSIGMTTNHILTDRQKFTECVVATTLMDKNLDQEYMSSNGSDAHGTFSTKLRSGMACELANVHQITGLGMTIGWTMLNMAFNSKYMHKILWDIPIFPNIPIFFCGLLILVLFLLALFPIPFYFLEIFITLSLDFILLPLMLLSWLFSGWKVLDFKAPKKFQDIINGVISGSVGIAMTIIFLTFMLKFLDAIFGKLGGISRLQEALTQNDSTILMDGLLLRNDSLITIIIMGAFFAIFMSSIPALVKTLFNIEISQKFYDTAKKDFGILRSTATKWWEKLKK